MTRISYFAAVLCGFLASGVAYSAQSETPPTNKNNEALGAPSVIPHPIADYLPITIDKNMCILCHRPASGATAKKGEVPQSHYSGGKLSGERYECTLCHASSTATGELMPVNPNDAIE